MGLGLVYGREKIEDTSSYVRAMVVANEICDEFQAAIEGELNFESSLKSTLSSEI
jgi:hypothetical protein